MTITAIKENLSPLISLVKKHTCPNTLRSLQITIRDFINTEEKYTGIDMMPYNRKILNFSPKITSCRIK